MLRLLRSLASLFLMTLVMKAEAISNEADCISAVQQVKALINGSHLESCLIKQNMFAELGSITGIARLYSVSNRRIPFASFEVIEERLLSTAYTASHSVVYIRDKHQHPDLKELMDQQVLFTNPRIYCDDLNEFLKGCCIFEKINRKQQILLLPGVSNLGLGY